ncbi:tyrosine recombinase [Catenibacterium sp.]|uniref:tyrosine recombinase n=1 Tax=Catenibacterium sp. TaxID=2049022 RepID=UPI003999D17E
MQDYDLKDFKSYLVFERGLSENTVDGYMRDLRAFYDYIDYDIKKFDLAHLHTYFSELKDDGYKVTSIRRKIVSLRQYNEFLSRTKGMKDVMSQYELPKTEKKLPQVLSLEEIVKVINHIDDTTAVGKRNKSMMLLLVSTGMRISELVHLEINDINHSVSNVRVIGKGNKERLIPLDQETFHYVYSYMQNERSFFDKKNSLWLFMMNDGRRMTRENFYNILQKLVLEAGVRDHFTPHMLRHTFATTLLENHCDLRSIQVMLGHQDISTTTIYTHVTHRQIMDDYNKFHPGNARRKDDE